MNNLKEDAASGILEFASPQAGELEALFVFSPELALFAGHFPDHPLVPGVLELEMVRVAMERFFAGSVLQMVSIEKTKFLREIKPGEKIRMLAHFSAFDENKRLSVKSILWVGTEKAALLELTMEKDE